MRIEVVPNAPLCGRDIVVSVTLWRWELSVQLPKFTLSSAQVPDPDRPGDLIDWSEARARRAGRG